MSVLDRFAHIQKLVINQDNGPENHSRRTQFMYRILEFSHKFQLTIQLAYYPPYHILIFRELMSPIGISG